MVNLLKLSYDAITTSCGKIGSYIPTTRVHSGINSETKKVADAIFSKNEATPPNTITRVFKVIKDIILFPFELFLRAIRSGMDKYAQYKSKQSVQTDVQVKLSDPKPNVRLVNDREIIENLHKQGFEGPFEMGGGGRCLFLSIAPQITGEDLIETPEKMPLEQWSRLNLQEQADQLRAWAMQNEQAFISTLPRSYARLNKQDHLWIKELYKDMIQELRGLALKDVHEITKNSTKKDCFNYVKNNFEMYRQHTERSTNWAGSSEAISLSRLFKRHIQLFGQDSASSADVSFDDNGDVLPYCKYSGKNPPIFIFQRNGGGHYQRLARIEQPTL